jgi:endonuclease YncB( thermonuclease family)
MPGARFENTMHRFFQISLWLARIMIAASLFAGNLTPVPELQAQEAKAKIRNVTPDGIPVIILPPRDELGSTSPPVALPDLEPPVTVRLQSDGSLQVAGQRWLLAGIVPLSSETLCITAAGERWACGVRAFIAMRELLDRRELRCSQIAVRESAPVVRCSRGGDDVSEMLLRDGWAVRDDTPASEPYDRAFSQSRKAGRGIWQSGSAPVRAP